MLSRCPSRICAWTPFRFPLQQLSQWRNIFNMLYLSYRGHQTDLSHHQTARIIYILTCLASISSWGGDDHQKLNLGKTEFECIPGKTRAFVLFCKCRDFIPNCENLCVIHQMMIFPSSIRYIQNKDHISCFVFFVEMFLLELSSIIQQW